MAHIYRSSLKFTTLCSFTKPFAAKAKQIITTLIDSPDSPEFRQPVDWQALGLVDYPELIKHPMDLGTVLQKLNEEKYSNIEQFLDDTQLIWDNCKIYNIKGTWIYALAQKLERNFKKMMKNYFPTQTASDNPKKTVPLNIGQDQISHENKNSGQMTITKTKGQKSKKSDRPQKPLEQQIKKNIGEKTEKLYYEDEQSISYAQKLLLSQKLKSFTGEQNSIVVEYLKQICKTAVRQCEDNKLQILVDNMDVISFKQLIEKIDQIEHEDGGTTKKIKI